MIILISVTMGGNSKTAKKKLKAAADVTKISTKLGKVIKLRWLGFQLYM